jgi:hypothetical protein
MWARRQAVVISPAFMAVAVTLRASKGLNTVGLAWQEGSVIAILRAQAEDVRLICWCHGRQWQWLYLGGSGSGGCGGCGSGCSSSQDSC